MLETRSDGDCRLLNPPTLAFLGDSVYELMVRGYIVAEHGSLSAGKLHTLAVGMVRAAAQATAYGWIEPSLTEQEMTVYRRGRNANGVTVPKSACAADYRSATGVEALFGWLYLQGQNDRLRELFAIIQNGVEHGKSQKGPDSEDSTVYQERTAD